MLLHNDVQKLKTSCLWSILVSCFGILVCFLRLRYRERRLKTSALPFVALTKSNPVFKSNVMDRLLLIEQNELSWQPPDELDSFREGLFRDIVLQ